MVNNPLIDQLAPWHCLLCRRPSERQLPLCLPCERELPLNSSACAQCALPVPVAATPQLCPACQARPMAFAATCAPRIYAEPVAEFLQQFKFRGDLHVLPLLQQLIAPVIAGQLWRHGAPDALVPVPLHRRKLRSRGFNQSAMLAHALTRHPLLKPWKLRVAKNLCSKRRHTPAQHDLTPAERKRNLQGAFHCRQNLRGQRLTIVDDVMTTGTTANVLAQVLLSAGARRVDVWCLARTPRRPA